MATAIQIKAARKAVKAIIDDLSDRRGLRQEWEGIDEDIQLEIKAEWAKMIAKEFDALMPKPTKPLGWREKD